MGAARALLGLLAVAALAGGAVVVLEVAEHPPMLAQAPARRVASRLAGQEPLRPATRRHGPRVRAGVQRQPARVVLGTPAGSAPVPLGPLLAALEVLAGLLLVGVLCGCGVVVRLLWVRRHRRYALFELYLSTHDHAKPQDVLDMVESIANVVRAWPAARVWRGQPFVALELVCDAVGAGSGGVEMEWSINVRCESSVVAALDGAVSSAYPDVRLGRVHGEAPKARPGRIRTPAHVIRFRKERSFVYPLLAPDEVLASPPLEQIALAQVTARSPSIVRFQLTPTPLFFDALARRRYRSHERRLVGARHLGSDRGAPLSTLDRTEMGNAGRTQNQSMFWLEVAVASDSAEVCKTVAAAVQARRGENRLRRIYGTQGTYQRRFPRALPPLVPSPRSLVSSAEVAHLLALPSARMKGVPVRRMTVPRIPAPPQALRASDDAEIPVPPVPKRPARTVAPSALEGSPR